jgi:hypothetical protein
MDTRTRWVLAGITLLGTPAAAQGILFAFDDAPPPTGGDWGPIFMADDLAVIPGPPTLRVSVTSTDTAVAAWPAYATGFTLEQKASLAANGWLTVTNTVNVVRDESQVALPLSAGTLFYRLFRP